MCSCPQVQPWSFLLPTIMENITALSSLLFQSPGRCETGKEDLSITDDTSSTGNKEDDEDEDEDEGNDENFDGFSRDPERLKAFNVRKYLVVIQYVL